MEYDAATAKKIKQLASESMDSTQNKIDHLNRLSGEGRFSTSNNLMGWQNWIGNISFALAAIGGAILIGKEIPEGFVLLSLLLYLLTGTWIALFHKRVFEKSAINASKDADEFRPLYDNKKKAAWRLYQEAANVSLHIEMLKKEEGISSLSVKLSKSLLKEINSEKVDYRNDIWLAMFITATYLMFWSIGQQFYDQLKLVGGYYPWFFGLVWLIIMLLIVKNAVSSNTDIVASNESKKKKVQSELRHSEEWLEQVQKEIQELNEAIESAGTA